MLIVTDFLLVTESAKQLQPGSGRTGWIRLPFCRSSASGL